MLQVPNEFDIARDVFAIGLIEAADFRFFLRVSAHSAHRPARFPVLAP